MTYLDKANNMLLSSLRQYRHNNSDGFVPAYDYERTREMVAMLVERNDHIESLSKSNYGALECCSFDNELLKRSNAKLKERVRELERIEEVANMVDPLVPETIYKLIEELEQ